MREKQSVFWEIGSCDEKQLHKSGNSNGPVRVQLLSDNSWVEVAANCIELRKKEHYHLMEIVQCFENDNKVGGLCSVNREIAESVIKELHVVDQVKILPSTDCLGKLNEMFDEVKALRLDHDVKSKEINKSIENERNVYFAKVASEKANVEDQLNAFKLKLQEQLKMKTAKHLQEHEARLKDLRQNKLDCRRKSATALATKKQQANDYMRKCQEFQSCAKTRNQFENIQALQLSPNENLAEQEHIAAEKACSAAVTHTSTSKSTNKTFSNSQVTNALKAVKNTRRRTSLRPRDVEATNKINFVLSGDAKKYQHDAFCSNKKS